MKTIKFTMVISEEQNEKLKEYQKKNFLENRSQTIRHLIDSTISEDKDDNNKE